MRTTDFTGAPKTAKAEAMFVTAIRSRGLLSILGTARRWRHLIRSVTHSSGYVWHTTYVEFPFTLGVAAFFDCDENLQAFRRIAEARALMIVTENGDSPSSGGNTRIYEALPHGYTNGLWLANENALRPLERFTAVDDEPEGPIVEGAQ